MSFTSTSSEAYFNFSASICSWERVSCDAKREHVVELVFSGMGLSGPIPDTTIGKLGKLESLDLSNNKITALPSDFWSLSLLKKLNLSSNNISGSLTNNIGNFGLLEIFDISSNNFSGQIPETIGSFDSLEVLKLDHNRFQQSIPYAILKCRSLVSIDLSSNQLRGTIPHGFGAAFPKLRTLNLAQNNIYGGNSDISGLNSIVSLNLSGNSFQGSVMGVFQGSLEFMDLSRNQFQGHLSQVYINSNYNWSQLVYLDLSENQLSGEIFRNLNEFHNLNHLNLAHNSFTRQKFPNFAMLSGLEYLNLSKTSLVGYIPDEISNLSNLNALDISMNHLIGQIPLLNTENLQVLDLSNNNFSGEVPPLILEKLPQMETYNFSYNNLTICASEIKPYILETAFFGSVNSCPIAANPSLLKKRDTQHKGMKLALALSLSIICLLTGLFVAFGCHRKNKSRQVKQSSRKEELNVSGPFSFQTDSTTWVADIKQTTSVPVVIFEKPLLSITFADLLAATSNFDRGTLLADGKFGPVYRCFLPGGIHVAVKVLGLGSTLTDQEAAREFEYLGRIKHPNLVPLTGYCVSRDQRIAIYDYMENGNLQNLLYDLPLGVLQRTDDWSTDTWEDDNGIQNAGTEGFLTTWRFRHKIALGAARALAFLHHGCSPPIIHRDVKASSVYLDYNLEPRLSDFGLAKIFGNGFDEEIALGTPGYVPPEFSQPEFDTLTPKSDVYCFGVVLLELLTGKKPVGDDYPIEKEATLVSWVRGLVKNNNASRAIDIKIRDTGPEHQIEEALKIGYLCTADLPSKRPSMQQIVGLLKDIEPSAN
ncbi:unnamed protein product [Lupinus luteus]|uniref:Protein kinase domain-containing protein n=1 Tax=Lupinus luteus TaxID=3873 RepID=A0AAV1XEJ4_LUPLU